MGTNDDLPVRYPVKAEDATRLYEKRVRFEGVPVEGSLVSGEGTLLVHSDGREGWAEIHTDEHLGPVTFGHHLVALSEAPFARIQETPESLFSRCGG
ncbi:MAG TPA: hypothetical protein VGD78_16270 [Chthoniobacterales bacterium]